MFLIKVALIKKRATQNSDIAGRREKHIRKVDGIVKNEKYRKLVEHISWMLANHLEYYANQFNQNNPNQIKDQNYNKIIFILKKIFKN